MNLLAVVCNDNSLSSVLGIVKSILFIIQMFVPLILIVYTVVGLFQLMKNPDMKNGIKNIVNKFIAAIIVFIIPVLLNVAMNLIGVNTKFSDCWNNSRMIFNSNSSYIPINESNSQKNKLPSGNKYEKGDEKPKYKDNKNITPGNLYGEAIACRALNLSCSAIGTNYLTAEDAAKVGCTLNPGDGRLKVPAVEHSHKYRAELPQTANIIKFWDEEKALGKGGIGYYGPASCSPWIGSLLRVMGYDNNISTSVAVAEAPQSPWTGERITNSISAHGIGSYMYNHPENFDNISVDPNRPIKDQCLPGDILAAPTHIMIYTGNELAKKYFPGTSGNMVEAAELGRCYPGVTARGNGNVGSFKVFRVKHPATNLS